MVIRRIDMAIMAIQVTDTDIIRTDTTDHIGTMAILGETDTTGTTGTGFTAITVIIITIATNLAKDKDRLSWLGHRFEPALFLRIVETSDYGARLVWCWVCPPADNDRAGNEAAVCEQLWFPALRC